LVALALGCGGAGPGPHAVSDEARAARAATRFEDVGAPASPRPACARLRPGVGPLALPGTREGSAVAVVRSRDGARTFAYVADRDQDAIHVFAVDAGVEVALTPIAGGPTELLVLPDGRVAVTLRDANKVAVLEPKSDLDFGLEARCTTAVAAEPYGLALLPAGGAIAVTSGFGHALTVLDTDGLGATLTAALPRDPRSVVVDEDGRRAFVSHAVGGRLSVVDLEEGTVRAVALPLGTKGGQAGREPRQGVQGFALTAARVGTSERIFAPMVSVDSGPPVISGGYGESTGNQPVEAPLVSVVDAASETPVTPSSTTTARDCLLPRSAITAAGSLYVTCLGTNVVLELEKWAPNPLVVEERRFPVPAGPTGIAADPANARLVVWSQFAHALTVIGLANGVPLTLAAARRGDRPEIDRLARGQALFHATFDRRVSRDGRACASCHPDGREDGLTWSTPDGPRQTPMLAGRVASSAPYGWFGTHPTLADHVGHTFERLGGSGFAANDDQDDEQSLLAYVTKMKPPRREGAVVDAARASLVARGRAIFEDARQGCTSCHAGGGADGFRHDVGSGNVDEKSLRFDTPSLEFISGTAPYFHDGRYRTLMDLLDANDGTMGHTAHLGAEDKLALAAYLETL
jgi:DNA-binding beta-propeller fold protein YncE